MQKMIQAIIIATILAIPACVTQSTMASDVIPKMRNAYLSSVSLITAEARVYCSGTIIQNKKNKPLVVLSASHCVEHGKGIYIKTAYDDNIRIMQIKKQNVELDIVVLVSQGNELRSGPHVDLARSEPKIGDDVWAIGNPSGEERVITYGIVSKRQIKDNRNLLRITADIYFGSSGGGLFNKYGKLVGVADMIEMGHLPIVVIGEDGYPQEMDNIFSIFPKPGGFLAVGLKDIHKVVD